MQTLVILKNHRTPWSNILKKMLFVSEMMESMIKKEQVKIAGEFRSKP